MSIPDKTKNTLIKPAHMIMPNNAMVNVASVLNKVELTMSITNKKVYLISRGCVYEHLLKNFKPNSLDRAFSLKNKAVKKMVKEHKMA